MIEALITVIVLIAVISVLMLRGRTFVKKKPSIPALGYRLFYSDQKGDKRETDVIYSKLLVAETYELSGKPDFIYRKRGSGMLLPVELKSGKIGDATQPHEGDLMQLVAYFLIIEDLYGVRPKYGRLIYKDCMFLIRNTKALRNRVFALLQQMRRILAEGDGALEDTEGASFVKCKHCMCRGTVCELCDD